MIPCTDFIPAYSALFTFLEEKGGVQAVDDFWDYLSDNFLGNLKELVEEHGIEGCWRYWSHTLNEEAADFVMELDTDKGEFSIDMRLCPSKSMLMRQNLIKPYHDYCRHCDVLYRRVLEPMGYRCEMDFSQCDRAICSFKVFDKSAIGET